MNKKMKFLFSKLKSFSNKKGERIKLGLNLFRSKKKEIKSKTTPEKNQVQQPKIPDLERILSTSSHGKEITNTLLSNVSIKKGFQVPPVGIQVINDFFNQPFTPN